MRLAGEVEHKHLGVLRGDQRERVLPIEQCAIAARQRDAVEVDAASRNVDVRDSSRGDGSLRRIPRLQQGGLIELFELGAVLSVVG